MSDLREKYISMTVLFPEKAGKLKSLMEAQKRLVKRLASRKLDDDAKALLVSVAESYEVADDLLTYTHNLLKEVSANAKALANGAQMQNVINWQSDEIQMYWNYRDGMIEKLKQITAKHLNDGVAR